MTLVALVALRGFPSVVDSQPGAPFGRLRSSSLLNRLLAPRDAPLGRPPRRTQGISGAS
jgi:hypothetical protein